MPDAERVQKINLPDKPQVGEVIGFSGHWRSIAASFTLKCEANKGHGRIVPLGSIQRVMKESIEAAAQYLKAHNDDLGIDGEWRNNYDVAVLAAYMGDSKEGPSAGVAMVVGIVGIERDSGS